MGSKKLRASGKQRGRPAPRETSAKQTSKSFGAKKAHRGSPNPPGTPQHCPGAETSPAGRKRDKRKDPRQRRPRRPKSRAAEHRIKHTGPPARRRSDQTNHTPDETRDPAARRAEQAAPTQPREKNIK
uniref:SJCHGC06665 protein n=1 Tax=Schistosoma japonicum TaxID=6182 RepID=Q5DEF7_SCHJA|nr:SJCHGC06665 protein [Schistosoma japonicum]